jgi:hypothetical protein
MRFLSKLALVALLALGTMSASHAQGLINPLLPVRGTKEVQLRGAFQFEPDDVFFVNASYGPFLDDARIQVGGEVEYFHTDDSDTYALGVFARYHFPGASATLPYLGVSLGIADGDNQDSSVYYGAEAGVKHFLNSSVALTGALVYRATDDDDSDDQFGLEFGLAIYLR